MIARILKTLLVSASLGICLQSASIAAEPKSVASITEAGGTVMVDHGKGFVSSKVGEPLFQGYRVITLDGSMAEITFTDGCRTKLKSNNLIVISIDPGCKAAILDATTKEITVVDIHPASVALPVAGMVIGVVILNMSDE